MKIKNNIQIFAGILRAKYFYKRVPLLVGWALTNKCSLQCKFCGRWRESYRELETKQILSIIDELYNMGTKRIQFTGGDPLLRKDIGTILECCKEKNISTTLSTNGYFVKEKIQELLSLDRINFSLDGPEDVHDAIRQKGSFKKFIEALDITKRYGLKAKLTCALTKINSQHIDFILKCAKDFDVCVLFQPATTELLGADKKNPFVPDIGTYREGIHYLIEKKRKSSYITNSRAGLEYLLSWPYERKINCFGGIIMCRIESNGNIIACPRIKTQKENNNNCLELGVKKAFENLRISSCNRCWSATRLEVNLLCMMKPSAFINALKLA